MRIRNYVKAILFGTFLIAACTTNKNIETSNQDTFALELDILKDYFQIPGLAVLVQKEGEILYEDYLGFSDRENEVYLDSSITLPMASLTKIFSGIVIMQLAEEGKLSLDTAINIYVEANIPDSIKISHVLSHTSQGAVGENFYYSGRFGWLTTVIEKASGTPFEIAIKERILDKIGLKNTYLLKDSTQLLSEKRTLAKPYLLAGDIVDGVMEKESKSGFVDYGFSAAAGITATVRDLGILNEALNKNTLISESSKHKMATPFTTNSPYGLGIFSQEFMEEKLEWGYGQYDCYSSLFLRVPSKQLTLILAANNNLLSDPARLINGDVTTSLFALSFLKNFVFDLSDMQLLEDENSLGELPDKILKNNKEMYKRKLLAQSLAASFMSRFDVLEGTRSKALMQHYFTQFPDSNTAPNLNVLFNLQLLKFMDMMRDKPDFTAFDEAFEKIGNKLLTIDQDNPYANYYMGNYYQTKNQINRTTFYFSNIISAKNFSPWWYTQEAQDWLDKQQRGED